MTAGDIERVYSYLTIYGRLGAHPYQLMKALNLSEDDVMLALESLQREGKVRVRSSNIEWKARRPKRARQFNYHSTPRMLKQSLKRASPAEE